MAYVENINRIGSGNIRWVQISEDGKITKVKSRGGLFRGDIRVVVAGKHSGKILIPFWENVLVHTACKKGKYDIAYHDQKNLIYMVFGNVYAALRYTYYLLEKQYGITFSHGEKGKLTAAQTLLEEYNDAVVNLRKGTVAKLGNELLDKAGQILKQIGTNPQNEYKREARDLTISLASALDSRGQVNPTVKMAKNIAVQNRLEKRMVNIGQIEPHIISRRQTLKAVIEEMELYWLGVYDFLTRLFTLHGKYDSERLLSLLTDKAIRDVITQRLSYYGGKLDQYDIIPFANTGRYVGSELASAKFNITHFNYNLAIEELHKSWNSLKLRQVRTKLEEALTILTCSLFGKSADVDIKVCDKAIFICRQQIRWMEKVDETGFNRGVVKPCTTFLQATAKELIKKNITSVEKAKEYLKQAASML